MSAEERTVEPAVPSSIESAEAKLVYLYVDRAGWATPDGIATALALQKLSVFTVLRTLRERNVLERCDGHYRTLGT